MKRSEQIANTKNAIINSALDLFGKKDFLMVSMNEISDNANISKGIIYHYYKSKDDLYLDCVRICFDKLSKYLEDFIINKETEIAEKNIGNYIHFRHKFFEENSCMKNIFLNSISGRPQHLSKQIKDYKKPLEEVNLRFYKGILKGINFRDGITMEDALQIFEMFQNSTTIIFKDEENNLSSDEWILRQDKLIKKLLYIIFKGIGEQ